MYSLLTIAAAALLLAPATTNAHFTVAYPPTIGPFIDDSEGNAPCGGYTPNLATDKATDFHVGGDAIATVSTHPQGTWLYRVTTDNAGAANWTQIYPITMQSGLGAFCSKVSVGDRWIGQKVVLSMVIDAPDGLLYQCAVVNLIAGAGTTPDACKNASSVTASFTSDPKLTALVSSVNNSTGGSSSPASSSTPASSGSAGAASTSPTASPAASTSKSAASGPAPGGSLAGLKAVFGLGAMFVLGAMLL